MNRPMDRFLEVVVDAWQAHTHDSLAPKKAVRSMDGVTPYGLHPTAAAALFVHEPGLTMSFRHKGFVALANHDRIEDTSSPLPADIDPDVRRWVEQMTFPGGSKEEFEKLPFLPLEVQILKVYDKVMNLYDGVQGWMAPRPKGYMRNYAGHTLKLIERVEAALPTMSAEFVVPGTKTLVACVMGRALCQFAFASDPE